MTMNVKEFTILKKAMMRTTSNNDAEALVSLRRANLILATHSLTWDKVFDRVVTVVNEVEVNPEELDKTESVQVPANNNPVSESKEHAPRAPSSRRAPDDEDLERLFNDAMAGASGSFLETLESIHSQWEEKGRLSPAQQRVVEDAAERYAARHPGGRVR